MNAKNSSIIFYVGSIIFYLICFQFENFFFSSNWGMPILILSLVLIVIGIGIMTTKLFHYEEILKKKNKNGKKKVGISEYLKKDYLEE